MPDDLMSGLHVNEADADELRYLLMTHIPGGVLHVGGQRDVLYGAGAENDFALKVQHDPATDAIVTIEPGPGLNPELLENLRFRINTELIESTTPKVGREILLSESPVDGYFKHTDKFQLLPVPLEAPHIVAAPGVSARHPFVLEVPFPGSVNQSINNFRRLKTALDLELTFSALIRGSIRSAMGSGRFHWVTPPPEALGDPESPSQFLREGYRWLGMRNESNEFALIAESKPIQQVEPMEYYAVELWTPTTTLTIPSNFAAQLDRFDGLSHERRLRWLRACRWFQHSSIVRSYSYSAAFAALIVSVEALIPEDEKKHWKTEQFEDFVERYLVSISIARDQLEKFRHIRAQILHGNELHYFDSNPLWLGWTPAMDEGLKNFNEMRQVARGVLVGWLEQT
jgi:hypothetical protein